MMSTAEAAVGECRIVPAALRCELVIDPLGIDVREPGLSWSLVPAESTGGNQRQTAYQIVVTNPDGQALWDTGRVSSSGSLHHHYEGVVLTSGQQCLWQVRVWDEDGRTSPWSETARWSMGLLEAGWATERNVGPAPWPDTLFAPPSNPLPAWIGAPADSASWSEARAQPSPLLRKEFDLPGSIARATVHVSALGLYELWLNGERVGDRQLAPEWTDYRKRLQYQTYDVTHLVRSGQNAVGAILAPGWYAGRLGLIALRDGGGRRGVYGRHLRLILQLDVETMNGDAVTVLSEGSWRYSIDGSISADLLDGEVFDARKVQHGWTSPAFEDSDWLPVEVATSGPRLFAQLNEPIRITAELEPVALRERPNGSYIFDFGQNIAGWCRLRTRGRRGAGIVLRHSEALDEEGCLYRDNLRIPPITEHGAQQEDRFILAGGREEIFEPRFTYHGFRYVEVAGLAERPALDDVRGVVVHSDVPRAGTFACSNDSLNHIMSAVEWTLRDNLHGVPTDCPQRDERLGWTGDMQVFAQSACYLRSMGPFFRKWLRDIRDAQADDGRFPDFAPHPYDPNHRFSGNPGWADAGLIVPWCAYVNYADTDLLRAHFRAARRWIDFVHEHNPDLIWRHERGLPMQMGDWLNGDTLELDGWPRAGGDVPIDVYATAFFARSTRLLGRIAGVLDRHADAQRYSDLADRIRNRFCGEFVSPDGSIVGDTQAGYALALSFDLLPEGQREMAAARMAAALGRYHGRPSTGFISTVRLMLELSRYGYHEEAYTLALSREIPSWGYMIEQGATTIWERWDGYVEGRGFQDPRMNSFNHYAIGSICEWMYRVVGGLNPDEEHPGWKRFSVRPIPGGGLSWASVAYESVRGTICSEWEVDDRRFALRVHVPPNTSATVHIFDGGTVDVGPGDHSFEAELRNGDDK